MYIYIKLSTAEKFSHFLPIFRKFHISFFFYYRKDPEIELCWKKLLTSFRVPFFLPFSRWIQINHEKRALWPSIVRHREPESMSETGQRGSNGGWTLALHAKSPRKEGVKEDKEAPPIFYYPSSIISGISFQVWEDKGIYREFSREKKERRHPFTDPINSF